MSGTWKTTSRITGALLLLSLPAVGAAQTCVGSNPSLAIAKAADLNFGTLGTSPSSGTAVLSPATGSRIVTGGVIDLGGTFNAASFLVLLCGPAGPKRFDILLPSSAVTLNGSLGGSMTVDAFTSNPGPSSVPSDANPPPTPFNVGATLHVGANQAQGDYTGVFSLTIVRQ